MAASEKTVIIYFQFEITARCGMAGKKGQTSVEFLIILAVALLVLTATIAIALQNIDSINAQKDQDSASNAVMDLGSAAKDVYAQGVGARKDVYIVIPSSYNPANSFVGNQAIKMSAGSDYVDIENFNLRGSLPKTYGPQWVWVVSEGNDVLIGNGMLEFNPAQVYVVMNSNSTASAQFNVINMWGQGLNVTAASVWTYTGVGMSGVPSQFALSANATRTVTLGFTSGSNSTGFYSGQVDFTATDAAGNTEVDWIPVTVEVIPSGQNLYPSWDIQGPLVTSISQVPAPAIKYQPLAIFANASDVTTGNSSITGCQVDADNQFNWNNMLPVDGAFNTPTETAMFNFTSGFSLGPHFVAVKCTDSKGNVGPPSYYYFQVNESDTLGPIVIQMTHPDYPTTLSNLTFTGIATDAYTGGSNVAACNVKVGASGTWHSASAVNGTWNTSITQNFNYTIAPLVVGSYTVYYQCEDSVGNWGGIYNDSFGVVDVDLMLVLDISGSMAEDVTNSTSSSVVSASSTGWSNVKNISVWYENGNTANLTTQLEATKSSCTAFYNATINNVQVATGNTTSTSYVTLNATLNLSGISAPFTLVLSVKTNGTSQCSASNQILSLVQAPPKISAAETGADTFLNISGNNIQAGLVSFSTTATTNTQLALMGASNQSALISTINSLAPAASTCIQCGLVNACAELNSSRSRPSASKVVILLTDGQSNYCTGSVSCTQGGSACIGCDTEGAAGCRADNVTVYTIGFGSDVDDTELTNIAYITNGAYYFAPNVATLTSIFQSIGRH